MANPQHLAILRKGVEAWNEWRNQNPEIRPDLNHATLIGASLSGVALQHANLVGANLGGANLMRASLAGASLVGANLGGANFSSADLGGADLVRVNLRDANAKYSQLCRCNLTEAILTGVKLYATARDDWIITGITCGYVFWDIDGKIRSPHGRDFAPGEFERIYRTLPIIEYIFTNGMSPLDPLIMDRVVQVIQERNPEFDIRIDSINARGLAPSIKFTVQKEKYKEPALAEVTRGYEAKIQELQGRLDELRYANQRLIDRPGDIHVHIINASGQYLALDGSTIDIDQHVEYITNLRDAVAAQPENSETFAKVAKKTALDIIGGALKDVAKGQVKKAAKQIYELGKDLGPVIVKTAAYGFFKSCLGL